MADLETALPFGSVLSACTSERSRGFPATKCAALLSQADASIANVATPTIGTHLGASSATVELVIGGYLISFSVTLITGARLGQTRGYRQLFLSRVIVFGAASLFGGLAPDATVLTVMRMIQGAGAAMKFPQALTEIQMTFHDVASVPTDATVST